MEIDDDDMIVVVVDDSGNLSEHKPMKLEVEIKQEPLDESFGNSISIDELLDTVAKHGEALDVNSIVKQEPVDEYEYEYLDTEEVNDPSYRPSDSDDYEPPDDANYDAEDHEEDHEEDDAEYITFNNVRVRKKITRSRQQQRKPWQVESQVDALKREHPELAEDEDSLVAEVANIMRTTKPPPPPPDFYRIHFENNDYECVFCNRITDSIGAAQRHFQDLHGTKYLVCLACGLTFRSLPNLYKHERRCQAEDAVIVLKARAYAVGRKGRHRPFMLPKLPKLPYKAPNDRRHFPCPDCSSVFITKTGLTAHMYLHKGQRPFRCQQCPAAYTSKSALGRHMYVKHQNRQYECDHCGAIFRIKSAIVSHMDTHLPLRRYPCPYGGCGRRYAQKNALRLHVRAQHLRLPQPCACRVCPKRFPRNSLLKVHMKKAHGLELITRKMFFKKLPMLSDIQVQQAAAFLKSDPVDDNYLTVDVDRTPPKPKPKVKAKQETWPKSEELEVSIEPEETVTPVSKPMTVKDIINSAKGYKVMVIEKGRHTQTVKLADLRRKLLENLEQGELVETSGVVVDNMPDIS